MPALGRIGNSLDPSIGEAETGATLNVGKKHIGTGFCPGDLQTMSLERPVLDGLPVRATGHAALRIIEHECIAGRDFGGRVIRVGNLDQIFGLAQERISIAGFRALADLNLRLIIAGYETTFTGRTDLHRPEPGFKERTGFRVRWIAGFREGLSKGCSVGRLEFHRAET